MENLNEHINRMKQLFGAQHGIIKPLVSEQPKEKLPVNKPQNNLSVIDKPNPEVTAKPIEKRPPQETTAEEKTFIGYVDSIKNTISSIFDKTYFQSADKKEDTKTNFFNDIENFKKIITNGGGAKPITTKSDLEKRIKYNEGKRWNGLQSDGMNDVADFLKLMNSYGDLNRTTASAKLKTINSTLKTLSKDIDKGLTNIKMYTPSRLPSYHELENRPGFKEPSISADLDNPWARKNPINTTNYGLK
jgi:hypothetical protein